MMMRTEMTDERLRGVAPSVFADRAYQEMSDRYRFIPTIKVIDGLRKAGIVPVSAFQSRSRIPGKGEYTKHSIRFMIADDLGMKHLNVGDHRPEIQLVNSHDGTASYRLYLGLYRCICSNQMVVYDRSLMDMRVIHRGNGHLVRSVVAQSRKLAQKAEGVLEVVERWRGIDLDEERQAKFAQEALGLYGSTIEVDPKRLLQRRRYADGNPDLWTVYNKVQENMIKGGLYGRNSKGKGVHTRAVASVDRNLEINLGLWRLADKFSRG